MKHFKFYPLILLISFASRAFPQDTTGFYAAHPVAVNPSVGWRESWFSGEWSNFTFTDNFSFTHRFYGHPIRGSFDDEHSITAFGAAMGDFRTFGPKPIFYLMGFIEEDSLWCGVPAVLSPDYVTFDGLNNRYEIKEIWCRGRTFIRRDEHGAPYYWYEETYVDHNLTIWARLPPHKTVQLWWGVDDISVIYGGDNRYAIPDVIFYDPPVWSDSTQVFNTWEEYFQSGTGLWRNLGTFQVDGPAPPPGFEPPGWAACNFVDWLKSDGASGRDWLPVPGEEIGLVFKFQRQNTPAQAVVRYNVFHISTWQGECMNYPVNAPIPYAAGDGRFFDFTLSRPEIYAEIDTMDFDFFMEDGGTSDEKWRRYSVRRYFLVRLLNIPAGMTTVYDTLWLKAHDYGAKAIVSPATGQTWRDLMNLRTTAFGQQVYSVSVPRDDDGQAFIGYNWGDFVADAWEEQMLNLPSPSGDSAVVRFTPFYFIEGDTLRYSDRDSIPKGRNIKGDGFCNWEEYRGFMTVGDQFGFYPAPKHHRLKSKVKEVMVHFMPNAESRPYAPGWMNALPDTMAYLVDYLTGLVDTDSFRLDLNRRVNINRIGAFNDYYASRGYWSEGSKIEITNEPADGGIPKNSKSIFNPNFRNAVVFWSIYRGDNVKLKPSGDALGYTIGYPIGMDEHFIPNLVNQTVVEMEKIDVFMDSLRFYKIHPDSIPIDMVKLVHLVIAHEFGHNIGMIHYSIVPKNEYIMTTKPLVDPVNFYRLVLDPPGFTRQYSNFSKNEITVLKEEH